MPRRRIVVALAALVLASGFATSVAHAAQTGQRRMGTAPVTDNPWPWPIICTEAAFTSYYAEQQTNGVFVALSGWMQPCPGVTDPGARRSFTFYGSFGGRISHNKSPLLDPDEQTYSFYASSTMSGAVNAICVIDGLFVKTTGDGTMIGTADRRACVSIDHNGSSATITPIPVTDPRVQGTILGLSDEPGDPHCGSCL